jgi:transposase
MWKPAEKLKISKRQKAQLEAWIAAPTTQQRVERRSRIVLLAGEGKANHAIAAELGVSRPTVLLWRQRFEEEGPQGLLRDRPRGSGKPRLSEQKVQAVVEATLHTKPKGATHWSVRSMAKAQDISPAAVQRIWAAHGLKPHLVRTFKLSRDPHFLDKLRDVVGLYLNPPEHGLVLCFDEKSQIQALDRTQPGLPLKKGRAATMTHDYKRHGTTSLFVALNLLDGTVIGECMARHRHQEFLRFLKRLDRETPQDLDLHLILDNYQTHKHPAVKRWLGRHPRFHLHFIPTSSSWLNLVERWLREITDKAIRRGAFISVSELEAAIYDYIDHNNQQPKPFVWTASADEIIAKVSRGKHKLETLH